MQLIEEKQNQVHIQEINEKKIHERLPSEESIKSWEKDHVLEGRASDV